MGCFFLCSENLQKIAKFRKVFLDKFIDWDYNIYNRDILKLCFLFMYHSEIIRKGDFGFSSKERFHMAYLVLGNGMVFEGKRVGAAVDVFVFKNTVTALLIRRSDSGGDIPALRQLRCHRI